MMRRMVLLMLVYLITTAILFAQAATDNSSPAATGTPKSTETPGGKNPLLADWTGPYGTFPPFDKVKVSDFKPALESAMADNLIEIDDIANNPNAPNFKNTIEALER